MLDCNIKLINGQLKWFVLIVMGVCYAIQFAAYQSFVYPLIFVCLTLFTYFISIYVTNIIYQVVQISPSSQSVHSLVSYLAFYFCFGLSGSYSVMLENVYRSNAILAKTKLSQVSLQTQHVGAFFCLASVVLAVSGIQMLTQVALTCLIASSVLITYQMELFVPILFCFY